MTTVSPPDPMTLSLCMIVKNEAGQLARCLDSVRNVVDEIIVVDTGSTDVTPEIAAAYDAKLYHFAWTHNFSDARNESLTYAHSDWILVLDADEVLVADQVPMLKQAIASPDALVVNLVRHEVGATQSPYSLVSRLFRNHADIRFHRPYHAMIDDSVMALIQREPQWRIVSLAEPAILHYGYEPGAIASRQKLSTAQTTMERYLADHPTDPYGCSKLGALYVEAGDWERGVRLLNRGLRAIAAQGIQHQDHEAPTLYELHYHLGIAYTRLQNIAAAEQHYRIATQQPILPCLKLGAYHNLGNVLKAQNQLAEAKAAYEDVLAIDPTLAIAHCNLGLTLKAMGQLTAAVRQYQQAIALSPDYADAYQNLGVALLKLGQVADSLAAFRRAIALQEQQAPQEAVKLRQGLQEMGFQV